VITHVTSDLFFSLCFMIEYIIDIYSLQIVFGYELT